MFNDALFFLEEAKKLDKQTRNDFLRWRYLRASIIYSLTSLEAYANTFIIDHIPNNLRLPRVADDFADEQMSLAIKFERIVPLIIGKEIDKTKPEWENFQTIRKIRNKIVHYTGGIQIYNEDDIYGVNVNNAEKGIKMVRGMIKQLNSLVGTKYPPWVDREKSRIIY